MGPTEQTIFEQFPYWQNALEPVALSHEAALNVYVGCGTSYNLAVSLAALSNEAGKPAIAVPGGEWVNRPRDALAAVAEDPCGRPVAQRRDHRDDRRRQGEPGGRRLLHGDHGRAGELVRQELRPPALSPRRIRRKASS